MKTLYLAGINETIDTAHKMGITTLNEPDRYGLSLVLGGGEVKLLDHVAAISVFANEGRKKEKTPILKVEDGKGNILEEYKDGEGEQVIDTQVARQISSIMSDRNARSMVFGSA
ncbi:MAG: glycosyl transferase family 51, partial [uncultured bacterium]